MKIELASTMDVWPIKGLLNQSHLVYKDITPKRLKNYLVLKEGKAVIGVIGLEVQSPYALLRSLAVNPKWRCQGYGARLLEAGENYSSYLGVSTLFLITSQAHSFFYHNGFRSEDLMTASAMLQVIKQFQVLCPPGSVCMVKDVDDVVQH